MLESGQSPRLPAVYYVRRNMAESSDSIMASSSSTTTSLLPPHLDSIHSDIHIIVSTASGSRNAETYFHDILEPKLKERGVKFATHITKNAEDLGRIAVECVHRLSTGDEGKDVTIILCSGDGGVVELVNALRLHGLSVTTQHKRKVNIALIPMGTANALAHSAQIVKRGPLDVLFTGKPKRLPMFRVNFSSGARLVVEEGRGRESLNGNEKSDMTGSGNESTNELLGCVVVSWGLHASLVAESDTMEMRKHGIDRFKMVAQALLREGHRYRGVVEVLDNNEKWVVLKYPPSEKVEHTTSGPSDDSANDGHIYVLAALVSNLEEHFCISPASAQDPLDGKLRLVAIRPVSGEEMMRLLGLAYQGGKHVEEKDEVLYEEVRGLRIQFQEEDERWRMVCVDGRIVAVEEGGWVEVKMVEEEGENTVELIC